MIKATTPEQEGGSTIADFTGLMSQGQFYFGVVTETGIALKDELSESDWRHLLKTALDAWEALGMTHLGLSMKIADILNWGEAHLGEKYANEIDLTRKALRQQAKTITNWQWVFSRVLPPVRHLSLTYSHHEAVAKLPQDEQREFLDHAATEGLTVKELRDEIKARHPSKPRAKKDGVTKLDNEASITQKLVDVANWMAEHFDSITEEMKGPMETIHKGYRRKWQNGHRRG